MASQDWIMPLVVGGVFVALGVVSILWGRREEKKYYESLTTRTDLREFIAHWPGRPQPGALKVGGWIAVAAGVIIALVGGIMGLVS
ncbi:MAG TPA: hypothetical protein G4O07_02365 [Dehalococcoidia bacterium]|nr:hypothetical protein [Dehalococcoidia bacterium]